MKHRGEKVFVGLSGGVDSAVTAALLVRAGAQVTGVFIKGWYPPGMPCPWAADRRDAMRVAARLGIRFLTLDAIDAYKKNVIDYLLAEYAAGRTPNPDVMCNRDVKFGVFADFATAHGADYIATGHYARSVHEADTAGTALLRGVDRAKDQSYFLWAVPQSVLARTLFPLGELRKETVRNRARAFRLPVAEKKDSQGICFLGDISLDELLRATFTIVPGRAVDELGREVGQHDGAMLYTIGARVALVDALAGPWYVRAKRLQDNVLVVAREKWTAPALPQQLSLHACNWIADPARASEAQYRYHGPVVTGRITNVDGGTAVFEARTQLPEPPVAGQSLVVYRGEECIGGGIIS
ncbi:MAG: tRNA 2-thiouridine(34) synthase MnmA [Parcubacteria group bacterium 21-54-25]|nr:MAG: tRNA 2-thiouridine(34) synthase MnmA [Parcubacteria group bacterium 21-54-25]HQU07838.1 tRNA 2-thiouridine(34) synthase MnmA [Candidatus Paceibacterota bacterium]